MCHRMAIESSFAQAGETVTPDAGGLAVDHDHIRSFSHILSFVDRRKRAGGRACVYRSVPPAWCGLNYVMFLRAS